MSSKSKGITPDDDRVSAASKLDLRRPTDDEDDIDDRRRLAAMGLAAGPLVRAISSRSPLEARAYLTALRKAMLEPFSKATEVKITDDEWNGETAKIRAVVDTKTVSWDVVDMDPGPAAQLYGGRVIEPIDWKTGPSSWAAT